MVAKLRKTAAVCLRSPLWAPLHCAIRGSVTAELTRLLVLYIPVRRVTVTHPSTKRVRRTATDRTKATSSIASHTAWALIQVITGKLCGVIYKFHWEAVRGKVMEYTAK